MNHMGDLVANDYYFGGPILPLIFRERITIFSMLQKVGGPLIRESILSTRFVCVAICESIRRGSLKKHQSLPRIMYVRLF